MTDEPLRADASDSELVPIREISRVTGVNTVTLRAWERRYGLLVPQRTAKGHRLYTRADIQKVQQIQLWLGRGIAIGKVKALLAQEGLVSEGEGDSDSVWVGLATQIHQHLDAFHRLRLEHLLAETFALYPVEMVADFLLIPLLENMQGQAPGQVARRAFFASVTQEFLQAAIYRQRQAAQGEQILLVSLDKINGMGSLASMGMLLLAYGLLVHQYPTEYVESLELREALVWAEALPAKLIVLVGYEALNTSELQLHLDAWQSKMPVVLAGNLAVVYSALNQQHAAVFPCPTMQQVQAAIHPLL